MRVTKSARTRAQKRKTRGGEKGGERGREGGREGGRETGKKGGREGVRREKTHTSTVYGANRASSKEYRLFSYEFEVIQTSSINLGYQLNELSPSQKKKPKYPKDLSHRLRHRKVNFGSDAE